MKCVCPMGGDRTCPDDCLIAVWHSLPQDQKTKERRRPLVEQLAKQGYTQDAIAMQLGVGQSTIQRDIETLPIAGNVKGQGKDTRGRKRSTGRPKGRASRRGEIPAPATNVAREIVRPLVIEDKPVNRKQLQKEYGISENVFQVATAMEEARQEAIEEKTALDPAFLGKTAQEKLAIAIRHHQRKHDLEFEQRVRDETRRRIDEIILPHWKEKIAQAQQLFHRRRGLMDKETFNKIRRGLHPDSRHSITDAKLGEAFDAFMALEKYLLNEQDSPTEFPTLPRTWQEWEAAKRKTTQARKAKYAGRSAMRPR
jgi:hypothetical protein